MKFPRFRLFTLFTALAFPGAIQAADSESKVELVRVAYEARQIEGWTVHVDATLLRGKHQDTGDLALRILGQRLHEIALKLPEEPVAQLRKTPIFLDRNHPLGNNHYHPDKDWLVERGYDPALARAVQITRAETLIREAKRHDSVSVMLHELAHAYHDQFLGFDHPDILAAYKEFCDSRKFDRVALFNGRQTPHYGLTDHKEYFAEMTETFFVGNNYYPFNHYQLYHEHRQSYELIARIWGAELNPPQTDEFYQPSILDLRIMANLKSQRGEFEEALKMVEQAQARSSDAEGRLASLSELIKERRAEAESAQKPVTQHSCCGHKPAASVKP
ncbi:hypothetical protein [Coraliomargarita sinensis]|nr:hypothetical protein [Coraliomargarita sinensis]